MMKLYLNAEPVHYDGAGDLMSFIRALALDYENNLILLNNQVVSIDEMSQQLLQAEDNITLLTIAFGG